jgi:transcriptional regulator with XRE-family HTH domain
MTALREDRAFRIGHKLRERRLKLKRTLEEVASRAGLTKGHLSAVERDAASPSVASLLALCDQLGITIGSLFEESKSNLVRADKRLPIELGGGDVDDFLLTPTKGSQMQVVYSRMRPGAGGGTNLYSLPATEEFVFVLKGSVKIQFHDEIISLKEGDALKFDPRQQHTFGNESRRVEAVALFVFVPPIM